MSLNDATSGIEKLSGRHRLSGTRSSILKSKSDFAEVLHFWGILSIQYDNRLPPDFKLFCSQSEALLQQMREWEVADRCRGATFSSDKYHVPTWSVDWRVDGQIRIGELPSNLMPERKKRAGRPPKNAVLNNWTAIFKHGTVSKTLMFRHRSVWNEFQIK